MPTEQTPPPNPNDDAAFHASRRKRSIALGLTLGVVVVVFYIMAIVKVDPTRFLGQ